MAGEFTLTREGPDVSGTMGHSGGALSTVDSRLGKAGCEPGLGRGLVGATSLLAFLAVEGFTIGGGSGGGRS